MEAEEPVQQIDYSAPPSLQSHPHIPTCYVGKGIAVFRPPSHNILRCTLIAKLIRRLPNCGQLRMRHGAEMGNSSKASRVMQ